MIFEITSPLHIILLGIANIVRLYEIILFVRVIFSWIAIFNYKILSSTIYQILLKITEPPLSFIRRHLPSTLGFIDLSVLWLFLFLELLYMGIIKTITLL